ncbi:MarR family winged helix-turn-helix transcriptional regulator [Bacillus sp. FJAT-42315]|uniref:MarR family winged helix-turn-helix transcriptional regulator n=1 Tax=Bacillus sp. FJAT-42315 TaxID=2014077 RepID=UPI000C250512|nr:MarR family transcriptional regulator [Bacillus sp. FJAT-42315]
MTNLCMKESMIVYKLHFLNNEMSSKFEGCTGLSQSKLELLYQLYQVEEMSQKELQQQINIDNAAITRHLKQLEANNMIARRKNPTDHRITLVHLTDHGRDEISTFLKEKERFVSLVLKDFTEEEIDQLFAMLNRIETNINDI